MNIFRTLCILYRQRNIRKRIFADGYVQGEDHMKKSLKICLLCGLLALLAVGYGTGGESLTAEIASRTYTPADEPAAVSAGNTAAYIRWIDFTVTAKALRDTLHADVAAYERGEQMSWITLLALLAAENGGDFSGYKSGQTERLVARLRAGELPTDIAVNKRLYAYYTEAYSAVLGGMVGPYTAVSVSADGTKEEQKCYGLRVFSPIAAGYSYTDYDDFGAARSYGYKRTHLGHDIMGSIGTPVVAIESGYVEHCGWNQYGGWRIGIRSFDGKRYYYYAHLRKGHPYNDIYEGKYVNAGEVIGYLGMTGYSAREDVNGINLPHLHAGLQIIFDASQIDGWNQIWVDLHALTEFWSVNRVRTVPDAAGKERVSRVFYRYPETPD